MTFRYLGSIQRHDFHFGEYHKSDTRHSIEQNEVRSLRFFAKPRCAADNHDQRPVEEPFSRDLSADENAINPKCAVLLKILQSEAQKPYTLDNIRNN